MSARGGAARSGSGLAQCDVLVDGARQAVTLTQGLSGHVFGAEQAAGAQQRDDVVDEEFEA